MLVDSYASYAAGWVMQCDSTSGQQCSLSMVDVSFGQLAMSSPILTVDLGLQSVSAPLHF